MNATDLIHRLNSRTTDLLEIPYGGARSSALLLSTSQTDYYGQSMQVARIKLKGSMDWRFHIRLRSLINEACKKSVPQ
jgi:hypothetical protein